MKKNLFLLLALMLFGLTATAQSRTITGTVTDFNDGSPLPGVSILIKGPPKVPPLTSRASIAWLYRMTMPHLCFDSSGI
ncbi:hypothetical protein [Pontibacter sp. BAB1700]|uniref:hypothetical protein n=1 Tax=Pontibacter sp. BAB1700 TaxID=1144253 RepID=UPI00026BC208|nr:TonB-dependent receptor plug [Pontibacter sp. BAB1700]